MQGVRCKCAHEELSNTGNATTAGSSQNTMDPDADKDEHKSKRCRCNIRCAVASQVFQDDFIANFDRKIKEYEEMEEALAKEIDAKMASIAEHDEKIHRLIDSALGTRAQRCSRE